MTTPPTDFDDFRIELLCLALGHDGYGDLHPGWEVHAPPQTIDIVFNPAGPRTPAPIGDSLGQDIVGAALGQYGHVEFDHPIPAVTRHVDLYVEPSGATASPHPLLTLLRSMVTRPTLLEVFDDTPTPTEVLDALSNALIHVCHGPPSRGEAPPAHLFILGAGLATEANASLDATADSDRWGEGFYRFAPAFDSHIIAIDRLPETTRTCLLRVMGEGAYQRRAIAELLAMPGEAVRDAVVELLLRWEVIGGEGSGVRRPVS